MPMELQWTPVPERPDLSRMLKDHEVAFVEWLAEVRYSSTVDAARWLRETDRAAAYQAQKLMAMGLAQATEVPFRGRRTKVFTASRHAPVLLNDVDGSWADNHPRWAPVSDQRVAGQAVAHALERNRVCLDMLTNAEQLDWFATWNFPSLRVVEPSKGVVAIPDALITVRGHLWCVEMERSWRSSTLHTKLAQYQALYDARTWGRYLPTLPRVLLVLSEGSTQERSLDSWLADLDRLQPPWVAVLPWAEVLSHWRAWVWPGGGVRRQVSWVDLHGQPARRAPPPPPIPAVNLRRVLKPRRDHDLPWDDH